MRQIWIIVKSEFLRRVTSKWFIITTLLAPVLLVAIAVLPAVLGASAFESDERSMAVVDETGVLFPRIEASGAFQFVATDAPIDSVRSAVRAGRYDGYLFLPETLLSGEGEATYYSVEGGGLTLGSRLSDVVDRAVEQHRLAAKEVPDDVLAILETDVPVRMLKLTEEGEAADSTIVYSIVGYIMGFFIYAAVFIYGSLMMQGVIEEKSSRVVEIMVSTVRPFQLLMGKQLGIGAMGLVQMAVWGGLVIAGVTFAGSIMALFLDPSDFNLPAEASQEAMLQAADITIPSISPSVFIWFVLFFLGGYLLYSSLFGAIGSAVEQQQDAQGLLFPVSILVIIPILFITFIVEAPNDPLSVALSLIPFFSPILMVVRVAVTDVPFWEVALSYLLLVATFIGAVWLSSRIYRVGILMYGKKASFKDLVRWFRYA